MWDLTLWEVTPEGVFRVVETFLKPNIPEKKWRSKALYADEARIVCKGTKPFQFVVAVNTELTTTYEPLRSTRTIS